MKKLDVPQSGSQASTVASRNRFGQYNRTRAMPTQPRTSAQVEVRERLSNASAAWRGLTEVARAAWVVYADAHPRVDSLGQTIRLTGAMIYVGINSFLASVGLAAVVVTPDDASPGVLSDMDASVTDAGGFDISGSDSVLAGKVRISVSPPVSAGVSFNSRFKIITTDTATVGVLTQDIGAMVVAAYGSWTAGKKFFIKVEPYDVKGNVGAATLIVAISAP